MISVACHDEVMRQRVERSSRDIPAALGTAAAKLADQVRQRVQDAASGDLVQSKSGAFVQSIFVQAQSDGAGRAWVDVGSPLPYASALESGFSGSEQVAEHLRQMTQAFGRPVPDPRDILVRSFARQVEQAGRGVFSQPLEEMAPAIADAFMDALRREMAP